MLKMNPNNPKLAEELASDVLHHDFYLDKLNNKSMDKFINQTKSNILQLLQCTFPNSTNYEFGDTNYALNFEQTIKDIICSYIVYEMFLKDDDEKLGTPYILMHDYSIPLTVFTKKHSDFIVAYLGISLFNPKDKQLAKIFRKADAFNLTPDEVINREMLICCRDYLIDLSLKEPKLNSSNILDYVPEYPDQLLPLFRTILNNVWLALERMAYYLVPTGDEGEDDAYAYKKDLLREKEEAEKEAEEATKLLKVKEIMFRDKEKEYLQKIAKLEKHTKELQNYKFEYTRNEEKLRKKNAQLREKYEKLKKEHRQLSEQKTEIKKEQQEDISQFDFNGNYLFVSYSDNTFIPDLKKAFPNATFTDKQINLEKCNLDMVIIFSKHVKHRASVPIKEQCKKKGIPAILLSSTNIDKVKQAIAENLYLN